MNLHYILKLFLLFADIKFGSWQRSFIKQFYRYFLNTKQLAISSYIENIETNLLLRKHTLRVFTGSFEKIVGKILFHCFIYVFDSICCISFHF